MRLSALTIAIAALVAASLSGAAEQPPQPIATQLPAASIPSGLRSLGPEAPPWARRLYRQSIRVLLALTDSRTGAMIAGEREGWDYVWPRDAAAGAIALEAAGLHREARRVVSFLGGLDVDGGARFYPDGSAVPGRKAAGDGEGWVAAAEQATAGSPETVLSNAARSGKSQDSPTEWRDRQGYGENVTGDLLGNAIAAGTPASEITDRFLTPRGPRHCLLRAGHRPGRLPDRDRRPFRHHRAADHRGGAGRAVDAQRPPKLPGCAQASVRRVRQSALTIAVAAMVAASLSGAAEQPPQPITIAIPAPHFGVAPSGAFSQAAVRAEIRPLGKGAPPWARSLYRRSIRVLLALTDPRSGAMIAGEREGWGYVWPRDAAAGAIALEAAGLHAEARHVVEFLESLDLDDAARFHPDGSRVPGRTAAGDGEGWVAAAERTVGSRDPTVLSRGRQTTRNQDSPLEWRDRQDYGENVTGDLLGNAIASGAPASEIRGVFLAPRGLTREPGGEELDSAAAWAVTLFPQPGLRAAVRKTLLEMTRESTTYGIPPIEGWTPGEAWTAPTAWSAWALVELGEMRAADRLLEELHRAETPDGTLPERVDGSDGHPTSTTPLAWSHAFAILALRARYSVR